MSETLNPTNFMIEPNSGFSTLNVSYLCRKWTVVREIPYNGFYDSERIFILTL